MKIECKYAKQFRRHFLYLSVSHITSTYVYMYVKGTVQRAIFCVNAQVFAMI
jgi:hypothetical protein